MPVVISGTNGITNATWTTAGRPASPVTAQQGYNTTTGQLEIYNTVGGWVNAGTQGNAYVVSYLLVAGGGGGGGRYYSGGGGAGGLLTSTATFTSGTVYTATVGAGGTGGSGESVVGTNGGNSTFTG